MVESKLQLVPEFIAAIEKAILIQKPEDRSAQFKKIFKDFGHLVPLSVILGGVLVASSSSVSTTSDQRDDVSNSLKAALTTASGGGSLAAGLKIEKTNSTAEGTTSLNWTVIGGEPLAFNKIPTWLESVPDCESSLQKTSRSTKLMRMFSLDRNWRVISVERTVLVTELLPPALKARLAALEPILKPIRGMWVNNVLMYNGMFFCCLSIPPSSYL